MNSNSLLNGYSEVLWQKLNLLLKILWRCRITSCGFGKEAFWMRQAYADL